MSNSQDTLPPDLPGERNEQHLVAQAQNGNQAAFEALYLQYNERICLYLTRMVGNDGIGCELAQDTFFKAWQSLSSLRDLSRFASWLYRIATNTAYNYQHREKLVHFVQWDEYKESGEMHPTISLEERIEETELLKLALAHVSSTYRPSLILYVVEGLSQRQVAELLGIKESCVSKYVSRGKEQFRQIYLRLTDGQNTSREKERGQ